MTKAEDAYKTAQEKIANAIKNNATALNLEINDLETIPPEITNLENTLSRLDLDNTQVADLSLLQDLTALTTLFPATRRSRTSPRSEASPH